MYIENTQAYYVGTEQRARRARFLILMQAEGHPSHELRAIVRKVALRQLGHWMMGTARVKRKSLTLSGSYGSDGLPCNVPEDIYQMGVPVPRELYDAWAKGGGWNSAGSEAHAMRAWARETFKD